MANKGGPMLRLQAPVYAVMHSTTCTQPNEHTSDVHDNSQLRHSCMKPV